MLTQKSGKELLYSIPVKVRFAGFESNTLALAKAGWELSMEQLREYTYDGISTRLAMRHSGLKQYAITNQLMLNMDFIYRAGRIDVAMAETLSRVAFDVCAMAPSIRFQVFPTMTSYGNSFIEGWEPIDARPQLRETEEIDMANFKFFKVAKPDIKDIIVSPEQVPELLDLILKTQKPTQDELRKKAQSRQNYAAYMGGEIISKELKPAHNVQAQIITLAG